jgi:hypothetical protein
MRKYFRGPSWSSGRRLPVPRAGRLAVRAASQIRRHDIPGVDVRDSLLQSGSGRSPVPNPPSSGRHGFLARKCRYSDSRIYGGGTVPRRLDGVRAIAPASLGCQTSVDMAIEIPAVELRRFHGEFCEVLNGRGSHRCRTVLRRGGVLPFRGSRWMDCFVAIARPEGRASFDALWLLAMTRGEARPLSLRNEETSLRAGGEAIHPRS